MLRIPYSFIILKHLYYILYLCYIISIVGIEALCLKMLMYNFIVNKTAKYARRPGTPHNCLAQATVNSPLKGNFEFISRKRIQGQIL